MNKRVFCIVFIIVGLFALTFGYWLASLMEPQYKAKQDAPRISHQAPPIPGKDTGMIRKPNPAKY